MTKSKHVNKRSKQRGFKAGDIEDIYKYGEEIGKNKIKMTSKATKKRIHELTKAICNLKREIQRVDRLSGSTLIVCNDSFVTLYH